MDRPRDYHTKWSKSDRETNIIWYHVNVEYEKYELIYTTETDSDRKQIYGHQGERC